ncbi:MAG: hypothetical protein JWR60_1488 [Polaromonas sp.]|nr:hypothetical protein [Polaromonas sp.]
MLVQPLHVVYRWLELLLVWVRYFIGFMAVSRQCVLPDRRQSLNHSGLAKANKAWARPAAGFGLQTLADSGFANSVGQIETLKCRKLIWRKKNFFRFAAESTGLAKPMNFVTKASQNLVPDQVFGQAQCVHGRQCVQLARPEGVQRTGRPEFRTAALQMHCPQGLQAQCLSNRRCTGLAPGRQMRRHARHGHRRRRTATAHRCGQ